MSCAARGVLPAGPKLNGLERDYAAHLTLRIAAGEVLDFWPHLIVLRLADGCRYETDFVVLVADGGLEIHETKGFERDDAMVKLRVAAEIAPFRFYLVKRERGSWVLTRYGDGPIPRRKAAPAHQSGRRNMAAPRRRDVRRGVTG